MGQRGMIDRRAGDRRKAERRSSAQPGLVGTRFGDYRLLRRIAYGGMAQLHLAATEGEGGLQEICVVKKILPEYSRLPEFTQMFETEAEVASLLRHPNIVRVFDYGRVDDECFMAMEWIEGASLETLMRHERASALELGPRFATLVGLQLCDALAYAHDAEDPDDRPLELVHRDVSPGNVLISRDGLVKLTDFGVVKVSRDRQVTAAGVVKGKVAYASPEQVRGEAVDRRSDLFSLGVVLYELATGAPLFKRPELVATVAAIAEAKVPRPSSVVPGFPRPLERVLMRLLAADPSDRYDTAAEVRAALDGVREQMEWGDSRAGLAPIVRAALRIESAAKPPPPGMRTQPMRRPTLRAPKLTPPPRRGVTMPLPMLLAAALLFLAAVAHSAWVLLRPETAKAVHEAAQASRTASPHSATF